MFITDVDDILFLSLEAPGVIVDSEYCYSKEDVEDKFYALVRQFSEEKSFAEIIKSDCGQCFGGYGADQACNTCDIAKRCKNLNVDLDREVD